jgi:CheY-like chemotaxis protein
VNPKTLLIVDDEIDIRESLRDALADEGYTILVASNGKEALQMARVLQRPCAVILDIIMPVMSGTEVYHALKQDPNLADIPVLISTSDPSRAPSQVPVLKKPINLDRLLAVVSGVFRSP